MSSDPRSNTEQGPQRAVGPSRERSTTAVWSSHGSELPVGGPADAGAPVQAGKAADEDAGRASLPAGHPRATPAAAPAQGQPDPERTAKRPVLHRQPGREDRTAR